jgi:sugar O-acyltransferase (sialic acid O-acetyltransferase NeuD family)
VSNSEEWDEMTSGNGTIVGLFGSGGFAREIMPLLRAQVLRAGIAPLEDIVFVDREPGPDLVNGHKVMGEDEFFAAPHPRKLMNVAVGDGRLREKIWNAAVARGAEPFTIQSDRADMLDGNDLGAGGVYGHFTMVTSNARIGKGFQCNLYSYVAHDCVIGDFVTFAPGVKCNGNVEIADYAYIGTGAILRQGTPEKPLRIGRGAVVGMGAVVTKDVPDGVTVVGNPARPMEGR